MLRTVYTKFSNERNPKYAIRTNILIDEKGTKYVQKCAEGKDAQAHVESIFENEGKLRTQYEDTILEPNQVLDIEGQKVFEFVSGTALDALLDEKLLEGDKEGFIHLFLQYADLVRKVNTKHINIDLIPQNILVQEDKWIVIDYEWVFDDVEIPVDFLLYRAIHYYMATSVRRQQCMDMEELFKMSGISREMVRDFERYEDEFQKFVDGGCVKLSTFKYHYNKANADINDMLGQVCAENAKRSVGYLCQVDEEFGVRQEAYATLNARGEFQCILEVAENTKKLRVCLGEEESVLYVSSITCVGSNREVLPLNYTITGDALGNNVIVLKKDDYLEIDLAQYQSKEVLLNWKEIGDTDIITGVLWEKYKKEKIEKEKYEKDTFQLGRKQKQTEEKYTKLAEAYAVREEQINQLQTTGYTKYWGKAMKLLKKYNPIQALSPQISQEESGIRYWIDEISYRPKSVKIRGWAYHMGGLDVTVRIRNKKQKEIKCYISRSKRGDVEEAYGLEEGTAYGYSISLPYAAIKDEKAYLEFATIYGRFMVEVLALGGSKDKVRRTQLMTTDCECEYDEWSRVVRASEKELKKQRKTRFPYAPLISVVVPLFNTPLHYLETMMSSVLNQTYSNVQLCLADGSTEDFVEQYIREHYVSDSRVVYKRLSENAGISGNTNEAFKLATGEFIMLCDHDDEVMPDACYEMVKALNEDDQIDAVYTDEDKMTMEGDFFFDPHFKTDFNLEFLRSNNYICHIFLIRKSIVDQLEGPFLSQYDGAQDYDFILRCCEKSRKIHHVAKVLYHWRCHPLSTAGNPESKSYAYDAGRNAVADSYKRAGISAKVTRTEHFGRYRSEINVVGNPKVSVVMALDSEQFDDEIFAKAIESVYDKTTYDNYEVILPYEAADATVKAGIERLQQKYAELKTLPFEGANLCYPMLYNAGSDSCTGDYLLFVQGNVCIDSENWMQELLGYCQLDTTSVCGVKIINPDDTIWHAGMTLGMYGTVGRDFEGRPRDEFTFAGRANSTRFVSAVSGVCMMVRASLFAEKKQFETNMGDAFYDVDFCLRASDDKRSVVYNAFVDVKYLGEIEAVEITENQKQLFCQRWDKLLEQGDKYYNCNLSLTKSNCALKEIKL